MASHIPTQIYLLHDHIDNLNASYSLLVEDYDKREKKIPKWYEVYEYMICKTGHVNPESYFELHLKIDPSKKDLTSASITKTSYDLIMENMKMLTEYALINKYKKPDKITLWYYICQNALPFTPEQFKQFTVK